MQIANNEQIRFSICQDTEMEREILYYLEDKPLREFMDNLDLIHLENNLSSKVYPLKNFKGAFFKALTDIRMFHLPEVPFIRQLFPQIYLEQK